MEWYIFLIFEAARCLTGTQKFDRKEDWKPVPTALKADAGANLEHKETGHLFGGPLIVISSKSLRSRVGR